MSLTSSDGTGLELVALDARAVVEDPLAFTELHLTFRNPQPRQIEGQFEITLPPGAALSRFAMKIGNTWQEGEVVELQAARAAYEDFLHRRQDPALLEKAAGNQFRARVFPIPASGEKELILSYSEERQRGDSPYRIYLRGLPKLRRLDLRATVAKSAGGGPVSSLGGSSLVHQTVEVKKNDFLPDVDFEVPVPVPQHGTDWIGLRHENLVVARVTPVTTERNDPVDSLLILFDTSASRALGYSEQVAALGAVVRDLTSQAGGKLPLRVLAFDQEVDEIYTGDGASFGNTQLQRLRDRRALGASNLEVALKHAEKVAQGYHRVLLFSDGVITAGATEAPGLKPLVQKLGQVGVQRIDALTVGGIRDESMLSRIVTAGLTNDGVVADSALPPSLIAQKLRRGTFSNIKVSAEGSQWVWPVELNGIQPGDQVLVYADVPRDRDVQISLSSPYQITQPVTTFEVARPLIERAWVGARINRLNYQRDTLAEKDPDLRDALKHQIIDLSTKFRVLCDFTALLVLETEFDYQRFKIDRRALTDILTVGATGIEVMSRKNGPAQIAQSWPTSPTIPDPTPEDRNRAQDEGGAPTTTKTPSRPAALARPTEKAGKKDLSPPREAASPQKLREAESSRSMDVRMSPSAGAAAPSMAGPTTPSPVVAPAPAAPPPPPPRITAPEAKTKAKADVASVEREPREEAKAAAPRRAGAAPPKPVPSQAFASEPPRQSMVIAVPPRQPPPQPEVDPYEGRMHTVMTFIKQKRPMEAIKESLAWRDQDAGDVLALIALGESDEALGQHRAAARAYGSIIDLYPGRADLRRFAGARLERVAKSYAESLAIAADTYRKAREQRPDHPQSHRALAYALVRMGRYAEAFQIIVEGAGRSYPDGRFRGVERILSEDIGLIAAAWLRAEPNRGNDIRQRLSQLNISLPTEPSLRFVLSWETDANDVDFHIYDGQGGHAFYSQRSLPSGGELYADVTTGYGPECFTIPLDAKRRAYPYKLQAHYYSRGPMGYGMGRLQIVEHDGRGGLRYQDRPFIIMVDRAYVDLGTVGSPLQ